MIQKPIILPVLPYCSYFHINVALKLSKKPKYCVQYYLGSYISNFDTLLCFIFL